MKKILAVGLGAEAVVRQFYEDVEIEVAVKKLPNKKFDVLVSYMALPLLPFRKIHGTIRNYFDCLNDGGELILFLPSLEWAAEQILADTFNPAVSAHLYGDQNDSSRFYGSGYTMRDARVFLERAGFATTHASRGEYVVRIDGTEYFPEMHILRSVKK